MASGIDTSFRDHYAAIVSLARAKLSKESAPISTATLAHEVYLSLRHRDDLKFSTREQFLAYAGQAMRSLLVDLARERIAQKRFAELVSLTLGSEVADQGSGTPEQLLALNEALERLGQVDDRLLRVAELRAVMGLDVDEVATVLGLSAPTVKRDWQRAKAFLHDTLGASP